MRQYASTPEARERILDAAEQLYNEYGLAKTTMGDVAEVCGYTASNVHRIFKTKSALSEAIIGRFLGRIESALIQSMSSHETPSEKMRAFLSTLATESAIAFRDHKKMYQMVIQATEEDWLTVRNYRSRLRFFLNEILDLYDPPASLGKNQTETIEIIYASLLQYFHPLLVAEAQQREISRDPSFIIDFIVTSLEMSLEAGPVRSEAAAV